MTNQIKHLSFSSICKLSKEPKVFYDRYVDHKRENFWNDNFAVGRCVHKWIEEHYQEELKTDNKSLKSYCDKFISKERKKYVRNLDDWEKAKGYSKISLIKKSVKAIKNFIKFKEKVWLEAPVSSEMQLYTDLWTDIKFKGFIDAVYDDFLLDYKIVNSFWNLDSWYGGKSKSKYYWQGLFYCLAYSVETGRDMKTAKFLEIKKSKPKKTPAIKVITYNYIDKDFRKAISEFKTACKIAKNIKKNEVLEHYENGDNSIEYETQEFLNPKDED